MTEKEIDQAMNALTQWFISQDLDPRKAGIIMVKLIARELTKYNQTVEGLQIGINDTSKLLAYEVAGYLRGWND